MLTFALFYIIINLSILKEKNMPTFVPYAAIYEASKRSGGNDDYSAGPTRQINEIANFSIKDFKSPRRRKQMLKILTDQIPRKYAFRYSSTTVLFPYFRHDKFFNIFESNFEANRFVSLLNDKKLSENDQKVKEFVGRSLCYLLVKSGYDVEQHPSDSKYVQKLDFWCDFVAKYLSDISFDVSVEYHGGLPLKWYRDDYTLFICKQFNSNFNLETLENFRQIVKKETSVALKNREKTLEMMAKNLGHPCKIENELTFKYLTQPYINYYTGETYEYKPERPSQEQRIKDFAKIVDEKRQKDHENLQENANID